MNAFSERVLGRDWFPLLRPLHRLANALLAAFALASCGGGVGELVSGVGSGGSGIAEGTITGFGSVLVDDLRYDDSRARLKRQSATGETSVDSLKIGQRVRVVSAQAGIADSVEVLADLLGPVQEAGAAAGGVQWLRVVGQWVRIESSAAAEVALTVLDDNGDNCGNDCRPIGVGVWVEVHGDWVFDSGKQAHVLRASRVERASPADQVLISGIAQQRGATVRINSASGTEIKLAGDLATAEANQLIRAWIPAEPAVWASVSASRAIRGSLAASSGSAPAVLGGAVDEVDGDAVVINGTRITIPKGFAGTRPERGQTIRAEIEKTSEGGWQLKAQPSAPEGSSRGVVKIESEISGSEASRLSAGLKLRGTAIAGVAADKLAAGGCTAVAASAKVKVSITARRGPLPLQADSVSCRAD
ncbi:MAG: hypothetical protein ACKODB_11205 [Betaproteobacteria bacterium]